MNNNPTLGQIVTEMDAKGKIDWSALSAREQAVLKNIMICHTEVCGCTVEVCEHCGHAHIHFGSCNCSACPQCGRQKSLEWAASQRKKVVNAPYFHIIMTVPDKHMEPLIREDPSFIYSAIMSATADTLKSFSKDPKYLGGAPGFFTTLHTWGQTLVRHIHTHTIFCGAGITKDGKLVTSKPNFLFPVKNVATVFRGKMMEKIRRKYGENSRFYQDIDIASKTEWNVEIRACEGGPEYAIEYTARYINRTAISNGRLISYENDKVCFSYKDYRDRCKVKEMELDDTEFLRRFIQHIPPAGFIRTRHYGFLSNSCAEKLKEIQKLTNTQPPENPTPFGQEPKETEAETGEASAINTEEMLNRPTLKICPECKKRAVRTYTYMRARTKEEKEFGRQKLLERARDDLFINSP